MQPKYIIRRHDPVSNKWQFLFLTEAGKPYWHDTTATSAKRFDSLGQAVLCLEHGAKELNWGGVHVVEPIYVL